jgi:putative Ca2+/H+ antiporter (TMEM165/GDT1 family)
LSGLTQNTFFTERFIPDDDFSIFSKLAFYIQTGILVSTNLSVQVATSHAEIRNNKVTRHMQGIYCLYAATKMKRKAKKAESRSSSSRVEHYYINEDCRGPVAVWFVCTRHMWGNAVQKQGCRELGGGPGQNFLGAPISKFFQEKNFRTTTPLPPPPSTTF